MNQRSIQSHVFCIFTVLLLLVAVNVPGASAEFYVIAGSRGAGTEIKSLPYTISSPGFYYITKNLSCAAGTHGITITADNVTLDLMGFSISGPGGTGDYDGIYMENRANVEIRNGTIMNFQRHGIIEGSGIGHRVINVRAKDNTNRGICLCGKGHIIERCTAVGNDGEGIFIGTGSTVTGNVCYENRTKGIDAGSGSTVTGNTCYYNTQAGIDAGAGSTITGNSCYYNYHGIYAYTGSTVTGNTCHSNTDHGIYLVGYNLVDQNTTYNNGTNMNDPGTCVFGNNVAP